jgi:hypothetical protein
MPKEEYIKGFVSRNLGYQSAEDWDGFPQMYAVNLSYI